MPINEKKEVTVQIDEELYAEILQYLAEHGIDMSIFVEQALQNELNMKGEKNMGNLRTLAFQVPEEFFQRVKVYLQRHGIKQKDFVIGLIERELDREQAEREKASETQEDVSAAQEENAPVDDFEDNSEESENTAEEQAETTIGDDSETVSEETEDYIEEQEDTDIGETEAFNAVEDEEQPETVVEDGSESVSEEAEEYTEEQEDTDIGETEDFNAAENEEQPEAVAENDSEMVSEETEEYTEEQEDTDIGETEDFDAAENEEQPEAATEDNSETVSEEMEDYIEEQEDSDIRETEGFDTEALPENNEDENMAADAEYPYIRAVWTADGQTTDCALENSTENIASFILRHKDDGEISFRTPDDAEVMTASGGAVMTASDTDYLDNELNPALTKLSSRRRLPKIKEVDYGEEPEYTTDDLEEETNESENEETAPVMAM